MMKWYIFQCVSMRWVCDLCVLFIFFTNPSDDEAGMLRENKINIKADVAPFINMDELQSQRG